MTRVQKNDAIIISFILIFSFIIWYPTRNLPYHWDSAAFVIRAAENLYEHGFNPFIAHFSEFAHPPLYPALISLFWKLFGQTRIVTHLTILPFLPILLISTYYLGKKIANPFVGVMATLLTAIFPFLLAEVGMPYLDLVAGALAALSLTLWAYRRYWSSSLILVIAVITKNTALLILIPLLCDIFLNTKGRKQITSYLPLFPPLLTVIFWLIYHHQITNWWLTIPGRDTVLPHTPLLYLKSLKFIIYVFFVRQSRFLLTLAALLSTFYLFFKSPTKLKKVFSPSVISLLFVPCLLLLFFAATGEFIPRYAISLLPSYTVLCVYLINLAIKRPYSQITILIIVIIFAFSLHPHSPTPANALELRLNEDLNYQDHIKLGLEAAQYLERAYPEAKIIGGFPQSYQLTEPIHGYISKSLNFITCSDHFAPRSLGKMGSVILYTHPYHFTQLACQKLLDLYPFTHLKTFNVNGKWVKLYYYEAKK